MGVNWKRIQFCKEQLSRHSCDNVDSSLNVSKTQKSEAGRKLIWCCRRLGQVRLWWSSTTWTRTGTRGRSGWARPTATRSLSAPASKRYFFSFFVKKGTFDLRKILGFLPCASARDDRRVFCFSSDRPRRLRRHPITWRETGRSYCSFFGEIQTDNCTSDWFSLINVSFLVTIWSLSGQVRGSTDVWKHRMGCVHVRHGHRPRLFHALPHRQVIFIFRIVYHH